MRTLFFFPQTRHSPGFEWALDIAQGHLDAGDPVTFLTCGGEAASCEINLKHRYSVCNKCIAKRLDGIPLLTGPYVAAPYLKLTDANRREIAALPAAFDSMDALKCFKIEGADLGMGVASSLISCTRDSDMDIRAHSDVAANLLMSTVAIYRSIQNWLSDSSYDRVYVFNGRTGSHRAALRAVQSKGVDCYVYENGADIHSYQCYLNSLPHSIATTVQLIQDAWVKGSNNPERETLARRFFEKASQGKSLIDFTAHHNADLLPDGFDSTQQNVAIFGSSEDEMAAIGDEWKNPLYSSQLEGLRRIRADIGRLPENVRVYLRVHPHLKGVENAFTRAMDALNHPRFVTIPGGSRVSSYALLRAANTVVSFGSTIGIEAVYARKPSVLAGAAFYRDLGATYNPATHDELIAMIGGKLDPKPLDPVLQFGYYMETFGTPFKYFKADGVYTGKFKGKRLTYGRARDYFWGAIDALPLLSSALNRRHLARAKRLIKTG